MTPLDYILGDHASAYLIGSSLLMVTLTITAAILDIPLRSLRAAGVAPSAAPGRLLPPQFFLIFALPAALLTLAGGTLQAYISSTPHRSPGSDPALLHTINIAFLLAVILWASASPLGRHWGLALAGFGLALAVFFALLSIVPHLSFETFGLVPDRWQRLVFAVAVGGILTSAGACLAAILSILTYVVRVSQFLIAQHRRYRLRLEKDGSGAIIHLHPSLIRRRRRPIASTRSPQTVSKPEQTNIGEN